MTRESVRPARLSSPVLIALVLGVGSMACGDSAGLGGTDAALDTLADPSLPDASLPDASVPDTSLPDASLPDAMLPPCPAEMVDLGTLCMDRYEAPNMAGVPPLAMRTALDGEAWCDERGKRLCSEAEWVRACEGLSERAFPYGETYERGRCNDDQTWRSPSWMTLATWPSDAAMREAERLYQAEPSGTRPECASEEGVIDLTGNVAEWVRRSFPSRTGYDHVMKGCYWAGCYGGAPPSCAFVNPAHPSGFRSYEAGFRCCSDRRGD